MPHIKRVGSAVVPYENMRGPHMARDLTSKARAYLADDVLDIYSQAVALIEDITIDQVTGYHNGLILTDEQLEEMQNLEATIDLLFEENHVRGDIRAYLRPGRSRLPELYRRLQEHQRKASR